jgi:hypothetical protein
VPGLMAGGRGLWEYLEFELNTFFVVLGKRNGIEIVRQHYVNVT